MVHVPIYKCTNLDIALGVLINDPLGLQLIN